MIILLFFSFTKHVTELKTLQIYSLWATNSCLSNVRNLLNLLRRWESMMVDTSSVRSPSSRVLYFPSDCRRCAEALHLCRWRTGVIKIYIYIYTITFYHHPRSFDVHATCFRANASFSSWQLTVTCDLCYSLELDQCEMEQKYACDWAAPCIFTCNTSIINVHPLFNLFELIEMKSVSTTQYRYRNKMFSHTKLKRIKTGQSALKLQCESINCLQCAKRAAEKIGDKLLSCKIDTKCPGWTNLGDEDETLCGSFQDESGRITYARHPVSLHHNSFANTRVAGGILLMRENGPAVRDTPPTSLIATHCLKLHHVPRPQGHHRNMCVSVSCRLPPRVFHKLYLVHGTCT